MKYSLVAPALLATAVQAWMPQDQELAAFNMTARYEQLGKRFKPTLPNGVNKIRGVNFGGMYFAPRPDSSKVVKLFFEGTSISALEQTFNFTKRSLLRLTHRPR